MSENLNVNYQYFTKEEVDAGLHLKLINYLLGYNFDPNSHSQVEIHIYNEDCDAIYVEWADTSFGEGFKYVDEDHAVLKELIFPDNHTEYVHDEDEEEIYEEWLKESPQYQYNPTLHRYCDMDEEAALRRDLTNQGEITQLTVDDIEDEPEEEPEEEDEYIEEEEQEEES